MDQHAGGGTVVPLDTRGPCRFAAQLRPFWTEDEHGRAARHGQTVLHAQSKNIAAGRCADQAGP